MLTLLAESLYVNGGSRRSQLSSRMAGTESGDKEEALDVQILSALPASRSHQSPIHRPPHVLVLQSAQKQVDVINVLDLRDEVGEVGGEG